MTICWDVSELPHPQSAIMQAMRRMWADAAEADRLRIEAQVGYLKDAARGPYLNRIDALWRWVADEYPAGWVRDLAGKSLAMMEGVEE